jgi:Acetyltransferase (GNAT) domain
MCLMLKFNPKIIHDKKAHKVSSIVLFLTNLLPYFCTFLNFYMPESSADRITQYRQFCAAAPPDFPIFMQDWYLDATCGKSNWDVVTVMQSNQMVAAWPFYLKKKWHWTYVAMPNLTRLLGPYLVPDHRSTKHQIGLVKQLLSQLPPSLAAFEQDCNYTFQNWIPLYWDGFRQTTRYSYLLELSQGVEQIRANIHRETRRALQHAAAKFEICGGPTFADDVFRVHEHAFHRQGLKSPFSRALFEQLDCALRQRNQVRYFILKKNGNSTPVAGQMLIWDGQRAYTLIQGELPEVRGEHTRDLLLWTAIEYAYQTLNVQYLDFMGSMMPNIELGLRRFGAMPVPYFRVQKEGAALWRIGKLILRN